MRAVTILDALADQAIFGSSVGRLESWSAWLAFLKSVFALPLDGHDLVTYRKHTGRQSIPSIPVREAWLVVGRRGGKSRVAALIAVFLATLRDYSNILAPGERGVVMLLAADKRQARVLMRYVQGLLDGSPVLAQLVTNRLREGVHLVNGVDIEIHVSSYKSVRGYTVLAVVADEIAFWHNDEHSANPDTEVINALRPGMATVPGSLLVAISSPYARKGALWQAYSEHYGKDADPVLVWQADTRSMNPLVPEPEIARAYEEDESAAAAEYGAQFRRDIESFVLREIVDACVVAGRVELPPTPGIQYIGFVDPSGGSADSMTLAISHQDRAKVGNKAGNKAVLDLVRERKPPFSPEQVAADFAADLKRYGIARVQGDRYGGEWPREQFRKHGIEYQPAGKSKSDLYAELLPMLNSGRVELLDSARLKAQLIGLERRTSRMGKDSIDHGPHGHDDLVNAVAGTIVALSVEQVPLIYSWGDTIKDEMLEELAKTKAGRHVCSSTCRHAPNGDPLVTEDGKTDPAFAFL